MKEIKGLSELLDNYISLLTIQMDNKKKNISIYDAWEDIIEKEDLSSNSYLNDFNNGTITIHVEHPGVAQQIRMKNKKIIQEFKDRFPDLNIKKLNTVIDNAFD